MSTLELTVLYYDGPIARAYLAALRASGHRPRRLIHLVFDRPGASRLSPLLPAALRGAYARFRQGIANNHWPRVLHGTQGRLTAAMADRLRALAPDAEELMAAVAASPSPASLAEEAELVRAADWKDPALAESLRKDGPPVVLFTGGGIVPARLLEAAGRELLHVHPAFLPDVRGADGVLWTALLGRRPAATALYLRPGIDTGPVLAAREFPPVEFDLGPGPRPPDQTLYRAVYSFFDPVLRAAALRELLSDGLASAAPRPQDAGAGTTYHFMHPALRRAALARIFRGGA